MENEQEIQSLLLKADQSDVKAMVKLADIYRSEKQDEKAFKYLYKSALYSYPEGERKLGFYYERGIGCDKDLTKAKSYYELAAMHGDIKAKYNIGLFYYTNKQYNQAFNYVKEAAEKDHGHALALLSYFYEHGIGHEQDYELALTYLLKAQEAGEKGLYHRLGIYAYNGYGMDKDLDQAFSYFYQGAEEGEKECYYYLGMMFSKGEGVEKDMRKASYWYEKGANSGDARAMYNLAIYYENGVYVSKDLDKSLYWLKKSADKGFDLAINKLQIEQNNK